MTTGLGGMVGRRDLAKAIAKNVPLASRSKAFTIAKDFGIKGPKLASGKMSVTQAAKLVKEIKNKALFKTALGARGHTAKQVLTKLVVKEEAPPPPTKQEVASEKETSKRITQVSTPKTERAKEAALPSLQDIARARETRAKAGGLRFLHERLQEEEKEEEVKKEEPKNEFEKLPEPPVMPI